MYGEKVEKFYLDLEKFEKKLEKDCIEGWEREFEIANFCASERERLFVETLSAEQYELYKALVDANVQLERVIEDKYLRIEQHKKG